jgi:hypothetical protein
VKNTGRIVNTQKKKKKEASTPTYWMNHQKVAVLFPPTDQKKKKKASTPTYWMNHQKVAVLLPPTEQKYIYIYIYIYIYMHACDYYGDTLASTLLKHASEANS